LEDNDTTLSFTDPLTALLIRRRERGVWFCGLLLWLWLPVIAVWWSFVFCFNGAISPALLILHGLLVLFSRRGFYQHKQDGEWEATDNFVEAFLGRRDTWKHDNIVREIGDTIWVSMKGTVYQIAYGLGLALALPPHYVLLLLRRRGFYRPEKDRIFFICNRSVFERS